MNRTQKDLVCPSLSYNSDGSLVFAGVNVKDLAKEYGTPLYLFDESVIRQNCNTYVTAMKKAFGDGFGVYYASKACSFKGIYRIIQEEGVGADVVSCGEIATAKEAGFNLKNALFHSNNKTDEDIRYAIGCGIGCFVADNEEELVAIDRIANDLGVVQDVMLRITPGIDPHTFEAINTGKVDSKFGSAIETGQAEYVTSVALSFKNVKFKGFHCHIGSLIFTTDVYLQACDIMLDFVKSVKEKYDYTTEVLDIGGGFGVRYVPTDPVIDIAKNIEEVSSFIKTKCEKEGITLPKICMEPGRSIVANAGITVYTVGTTKKIPGYKNYVSVDGGMTDNPRFALYGSAYTVLTVDNLGEEHCEFSVVGRCCESGDIIQEHVSLSKNVKRGDLICVQTTGAYNYSMASNYNRIPRPPVVIVRNGTSYVAVRRETYEDIFRLDN